MRKTFYLMIVCCVLSVSLSWAQNIGDYRSNVGTGNWSTLTTWQTWDGTAWVAATVIPSNTFTGTITIQSGHTINTGGSRTIAGTLVNEGTLTLSTIPNVSTQVNGTFINRGTIIGSTTLRLRFNAGSVYDHQFTVTAGIIPLATWDISSTCQVTGYTTNATAPTIDPNSSFGNFIWNTPNLDQTGGGGGGSIDLNASLKKIAGNFSIISTGVDALYLNQASGSAYTLNVGKNFIISGGVVIIDEASTGGTTVNTNMLIVSAYVQANEKANVIINVASNFSLIGGGNTFDLSAGAGNTALNVGGDFTQGAGTILANSFGSSSVVTFTGSKKQIFSSAEVIINSVNFAISNGASLEIAANSFLSGPGSFNMGSASTLYIGSAAGILNSNNTNDGNIRVSGTRSYGSGATIVYNGTVPQFLGNGFPSDVNLVIDNASNVSLSVPTMFTPNTTLTLTAGRLNIGANTLTLNGALTSTAGQLAGGSSSSLTIGGSGGSVGPIPFAAGTNQLLNFTINRSAGEVVLGSSLTIVPSGNLALTAGTLALGNNQLSLNGNFTRVSGILKGGTNSVLTIGGTGALTNSIAFSSSDNILRRLDMQRGSNGTATIESNLTVTDTLFLTAGALTTLGQLNIPDGGSVKRTFGSISATPNYLGSYHLYYLGAVTTGPEISTDPSKLLNLTVNATGTVVLNSDVTINGLTTISNGILNGNGKSINVKSNWINNGTFNGNASTVTFSGSTTLSGTPSGTSAFANITITGTLTSQAGNVNIAGNLVNNGVFIHNNGTVTFTGNTILNGSNALSLNNVIITNTLIGPVNNFNVAGNWTNNGVFTPNTGTITFNGTTNIGGSEINSFPGVIISGILNAPTAANINISGDFTNNGTFNHNLGTVTFNGTNGVSGQTIGGTSVTDFNNITIVNSTSVGVKLGGNQRLLNTLTLSSSTSKFITTGFTFTFVSTNDRTARLAPVPDGASIVGDITVQRYMPNSSRLYRYLGSPVTTAKVADWQNDFYITGTFTGANNVTNPSRQGLTSNPSLYYYDEMGDGTMLTADYKPYPTPGTGNINDPLVNGKGYAAFIRNINANFTFDVAGNPFIGTKNYGVTYTPGGGANTQGWNLIANPYPSDIIWDNSGKWTKTNVSSTIYFTDNVRGTTATYNAATGVGVNGSDNNGGSGQLPSSQGFWVVATGSSPSLTSTEAVKATNNPAFTRVAASDNLLRIKLASGSAYDNAVVMFYPGATDGLDIDYDGLKFPETGLSLSTAYQGSQPMAINSLGALTNEKIVELIIKQDTIGSHKLVFTEANTFDTQIYLVDKYLNRVIDVKQNPEYNFMITADARTTGNERFRIVFGQIPENLLKQGEFKVFPNPSDGKAVHITLANAEGIYSLEVYDMLGRMLYTKDLTANDHLIEKTLDLPSHLRSGVYHVILKSASQRFSKKLVIKE